MSTTVTNEANSNTRVSQIIITIDGPAGAGKSSVARQLAEYFGFAFLDTGAMYRAVTLACLRRQVPWQDPQAVAEVAKSSQIRFQGNHVLLDGEDVSEQIRSSEVNANIKHVADLPSIRQLLGQLQRSIAAGQQIVTEGRDQGTEIFPDANCKIFLTATPRTRAVRRHAELVKQHPELSVDDVLAAQQRRDQEDAQRPVGALRPAADAEVFYSDDLSQAEVVEQLAKLIRTRCGAIKGVRPL